MCATDVLKLEQALGDVRSLVDDLNTSISKQAKIGSSSGGAGLARERSAVNWGAVTVADNLTNVLVTWARIVSNEEWRPTHGRPVVVQAAWLLLGSMPEIRRHAAVDELVDEVADAVEQARRIIDRPADRVYVGKCRSEGTDEYGQTVECGADLYARPGATEVRCKVCMADTDVKAQQEWLMKELDGRTVTVRQAAQVIGSFYGSDVTEASIRGLIHRKKKLSYLPDTKLIRLGDLIAVLTDRKVAA